MPLIECYDCSAAVSDSAESCPHCGFSVKRKQGGILRRLSREPRVTLSHLDVAKSTLGRVLSGGLMFAAASDLVLAIAALVVAGSNMFRSV